MSIQNTRFRRCAKVIEASIFPADADRPEGRLEHGGHHQRQLGTAQQGVDARVGRAGRYACHPGLRLGSDRVRGAAAGDRACQLACLPRDHRRIGLEAARDLLTGGRLRAVWHATDRLRRALRILRCRCSGFRGGGQGADESGHRPDPRGDGLPVVRREAGRMQARGFAAGRWRGSGAQPKQAGGHRGVEFAAVAGEVFADGLRLDLDYLLGADARYQQAADA